MNNYIGKYKTFNIYISDKYPKKYYALVNNKKVYFGDIRYQHFYDKMGYYNNLNHNDKERRRLYKARHQKTSKKIASPSWFALKVLW